MELDIAKTEAEIARLQAEVDAERARLARLSPEQAEAEFLHNAVCRHNHTDGCGWYHETWDNLRGEFSERRAYLKRVAKLKQELPQGVDIPEAVRIYRMVQGYGS